MGEKSGKNLIGFRNAENAESADNADNAYNADDV